MDAVDTRRRLLLKATGASVAGCCALQAETAAAQDVQGMMKGDLLIPAKGENLTPVKADDLKVGGKPLLVWPYDLAQKTARSDSRLNKLLLIRMDPAEMSDEMKQRSAGGVLAYSSICTHQACDVTEFVGAEKLLMCFCHFSKFNPGDGSVAKGPATKSLPSVPLAEKDGFLVVAGGFSNKPGV